VFVTLFVANLHRVAEAHDNSEAWQTRPPADKPTGKNKRGVAERAELASFQAAMKPVTGVRDTCRAPYGALSRLSRVTIFGRHA
jgi:hypothetical protein